MKQDQAGKIVRWQVASGGNICLRVMSDEWRNHVMASIETTLPFELLASLYQVACDKRSEEAQAALFSI